MKKEALVIVDMSNDFVADNGTLTAGKPAQEIVPYIVELANKFIHEGNHVVMSMDAHIENDPHFELWPAHNVVGTEGQKPYGDLGKFVDEVSGFIDNVAGSSNYHYVPKTNYNAFFGTDLAEKLKALEVEKVHLVGVCTDICIFLTASGADAEGFKTAVHKRGVATFTDQGETFINHMKTCFHSEIIE